VCQAGGWKRFVKIAPLEFVVSAPSYSTVAPGLFKAKEEGGLPLEAYLIESKAGPVCRIRRSSVLLQTTGYAVEDALSGQMLFE
jgi:hypothetical protein